MAKKKGRWAKDARGVALPLMAGEIIGNALSQVLADGMGYIGKRRGKKKGKWLGNGDPAEAVVRTLATSGAQSVPDMVRATGFRLTSTLRALHELQEFGLVKVAGEDKTITLTAAGTRTATAMEGNALRKETGKIVES